MVAEEKMAKPDTEELRPEESPGWNLIEKAVGIVIFLVVIYFVVLYVFHWPR